mmetsp:Transcript_2717/g.3733  ORF Transcript_2717/g.3733 Transcript_2717/m.3733 type:complete len:95 (+) Transcript_2717:209-493(+)
MYSYHHFNPCLPSSNMLQLRQERDVFLECKMHHFLDDENVNRPSNACFLLLLHPSNDHQPILATYQPMISKLVSLLHLIDPRSGGGLPASLLLS